MYGRYRPLTLFFTIKTYLNKDIEIVGMYFSRRYSPLQRNVNLFRKTVTYLNTTRQFLTTFIMKLFSIANIVMNKRRTVVSPETRHIVHLDLPIGILLLNTIDIAKIYVVSLLISATINYF